MKKIVSLVLALVLVLAIAAPAMAITGAVNPTQTATAYAPFYDIDLVLIEAPLSGIGVLSLQAVAANKAYIKDGLVHFALYYKTGDTDTITMAGADFADPAALISSDIVTFYPNTVQEYSISTTGGITPVIVNGAGVTEPAVKTISIPLADPTTNVTSYVIVGSGAVSVAANGTILAEILGVQNSIKFAPFAYVAADPVTAPDALLDDIEDQIGALNGQAVYSGATVKYNLSAIASGTDELIYTVALPDSNDTDGNPDGAVIFTASLAQTIASGSAKNLSKIEVVDNNTNRYLVVDQGSVLAGGGTSSLKFYLGGAEVTNATTIANLTSIYTGVMTFFGFNYTAAGVLHPVHFGRKLSVFYANDSAAITLYTSAITVPDEDTDVPQTGDAASSIGFVMIALAIVAAAGVAYKKVRA